MQHAAFAACLAAQGLFYVLAGIGWAWDRANRDEWRAAVRQVTARGVGRSLPGIMSAPYAFVLLNVAAVRGLFHFLTGRHTARWAESRHE